MHSEVRELFSCWIFRFNKKLHCLFLTTHIYLFIEVCWIVNIRDVVLCSNLKLYRVTLHSNTQSCARYMYTSSHIAPPSLSWSPSFSKNSRFTLPLKQKVRRREERDEIYTFSIYWCRTRLATHIYTEKTKISVGPEPDIDCFDKDSIPANVAQ